MANRVNTDQTALTASIMVKHYFAISSLPFNNLIMPKQIVIPDQTAPEEKSDLF